MIIFPFTSHRRTEPLLFISTLTCSTMSKKTCGEKHACSTFNSTC